MRWGIGRKSSNVEDRRGSSVSPGGLAGGGLGLLVLALVASLFGVNPSFILDQVQQLERPPVTSGPANRPTAENQLAEFVSLVLADTEDTWQDLFKREGLTYKEPKLVLFTGQIDSACGLGQAAMGPFYCPGDQKVYIDLSFYDDLKQRYQAPGDFAQAYVIAHEVGHHVQNLLGVAEKVHRLQRQASEAEGNALSVRMELQADCYAGVWGYHAKQERNLIEPGDFEEGLRAAAAIGDDRLQEMSRGHVQPESWTHGSSEQRMTWLKRGLESGDPSVCNTFEGNRL
ncbi:MAG: flagellar biosynthesis protein FlgM [Acaryochloridaceae cyanobacterium CSU_5_19]|nr:flagellar biosynthesis protein FlgM [Acaryochloridaceae cyanobacterium CSU_5_19]